MKPVLDRSEQPGSLSLWKGSRVALDTQTFSNPGCCHVVFWRLNKTPEERLEVQRFNLKIFPGPSVSFSLMLMGLNGKQIPLNVAGVVSVCRSCLFSCFEKCV